VVTVWLDASGRVISPPGPGQVASDAALAAVMTLVAVALASRAALQLTRRFLNRRRLAAWEAAWSAIGPQWRRHGA
jgi:DMSO/TMAO reductase YedYZ heme-binding membrane subunit